MSTSFEIQSKTGGYSVSVQSGFLNELLSAKPSDTLLVDEWFAPQFQEAGVPAIFVPAEETTKSLDAIPGMIVALRQSGANRRTRILAIGGGIVQDAACFIASIYMRGVEWDYLPTTLLAMVDSCIGGKSSINVGPYKNLVGTFHPPSNIRIDPTLVESLPLEGKISGLLEACKICYCRGSKTFGEYLLLRPGPTMHQEHVRKMIELSLTAKKWFIEIDEFDKAERLLLNFGHTFGHALEGASNFRIAHGIAVGVGMLCALQLGRLMGREYSTNSEVAQLEGHVRDLLSQAVELRGELQKLQIAEILNRFEADKKHGSSHYSVIVVNESGAVELAKLPKSSDNLALFERSIGSMLEDLTSSRLRHAVRVDL